MSNLKPLGPLGVSPASGYGHVAGTSARFFGEGIIYPRFYSWHAFFQIRPGKFNGKNMVNFYVGPTGSFIYGATAQVTNLDTAITPSGTRTYVYIECDVTSAAITSAQIKGYSTQQSLFEPEGVLAEQTKVRHFLGIVVRSKPFPKFGRNLTYPIIQSSFSVPIAIPACVNGFRGVLITTT